MNSLTLLSTVIFVSTLSSLIVNLVVMSFNVLNSSQYDLSNEEIEHQVLLLNNYLEHNQKSINKLIDQVETLNGELVNMKLHLKNTDDAIKLINISKTNTSEKPLLLTHSSKKALQDEPTDQHQNVSPESDLLNKYPQEDILPDPSPYQNQVDGEVNYLTDILLNEDVDPDWSYEMESTIMEKFTGTELPINVNEIICRSSFCKVQITQSIQDIEFDLAEAFLDGKDNEPSAWNEIEEALTLQNIDNNITVTLDEHGNQLITHFIGRNEDTEIPVLP